ncbi:MAG: phosphate signaling complex PhoU family protein [Phycisphaerales bacterium]
MGFSAEIVAARLAEHMAGIVAQGRRVQRLVEASFDAVFSRDEAAATQARALDEEVDRVDVEIERAAVDFLAEVCRQSGAMSPAQLREVLTIVKVNNELERIADLGVMVCEEVRLLNACGPLPPAFRVMTNSVVGIVRDVTASLERKDPELAKVVLLSEETVAEFKRTLVRDSQKQFAAGQMNMDMILGITDVATLCVGMVDHCTNIAEQVIYSATGTIVRHMEGHWEEVKLP